MLPDTAIKEGRGFLTDVLKQAGINGLLLLILCGILVWTSWRADQNAERRETRFFTALTAITANQYAMQDRTISAITTSTEVMRAAKQVMADNTRVLHRLARKPAREPDDG